MWKENGRKRGQRDSVLHAITCHSTTRPLLCGSHFGVSQKIPCLLAMVNGVRVQRRWRTFSITTNAFIINIQMHKMKALWRLVLISYSFIDVRNYVLSKAAKWAILLWSLCLSKIGSLLRISRSKLEVGHIFEPGNLYNLRFIESEICLPLFEYETQTEHKKRTPICF